MGHQSDELLDIATRFRVSKVQYIFAIIALLALISLGISSLIESRTTESRSKILSNVETPAATIIFSQRETLVYATKLALWANGGTTRREVQIARNLLAQRLEVVDSSGISMGERADRAYWSALKSADVIVNAAPMGILPESAHRQTNKVLLPVIDAIVAEARNLVVSYQKSVDSEMAAVARKTAERDSFNLLLLYIFIFFGGSALLINIRGNFRNYRSVREGLALEISHLDATEARLREAERTVTQLKDLDSAKNSLISTVNHELRTPLTSIIGYIELLRRDFAAKETTEIMSYIDVVERNSYVLLSLVESLLSLSKFDGQQGRLPDELIDLREILGDAVFTVTPALSPTKSHIIIHPSISAQVRGDKGQLNQIFINLLANAIKFSVEDREILISMAMIDPEKIEVSVADHGIGIADEDIPRIFTRFFRAANVQLGGFEGFGLGLAIVQQAVEHHGGSISVESKLGEGSIFKVTLPIAQAGEMK